MQDCGKRFNPGISLGKACGRCWIIVYGTDARQAGQKVRVVMKMEGHQPVLYPIAVVSASPHAKLAQEFVDFVLSPAGRTVLEKYGFDKPE